MNTKLKISFLVVFLLFWVKFSISSQIISGVSEGRIIDDGLFGLNGRSTEGPSWTDPEFIKLVKDINPGLVRYPAGTQANYWDWSTGGFIEGCGKTSEFPFTIEMLAAGLPEKTGIIYVMNMVRTLPWTNISPEAPFQVLASDSVLNYKIKDVIQALQEFKNQNRFPVALELGNEFYFDNEHGGIYAANPDLYLRHAEKITDSVLRHFPDLKIILITTKEGSNLRDYWNSRIIKFLADHPVFSAKVSGLVQHHYINDSFGDLDLVNDEYSSVKAIWEAKDYMNGMTGNYNMIPEDKELWLTEVGVSKENAVATWTAGLRGIVYMSEFALLGPKVKTVLYHHITEESVINKVFLKEGGVGLAVELLQKAVSGNTFMQRIEFDNNPLIYNQFPALYGYSFSGNDHSSIVLVNTGNQEIFLSGLQSLTGNSFPAYSMQYYSDSPWITKVYKTSGISFLEQEVNDELLLKPFSMCLISTANHSSNSNSLGFKTQFKELAWPNPFREQLKFNSDLPENVNYSIWDPCGRLIMNGVIQNHTLSIPGDLPAGIYVVGVYTTQGMEAVVLTCF